LESQLLISYSGEVDNAVVKGLVSATEDKLDRLGFKKFVTKKINSVFIEILQNLSNHTPDVAVSVEHLPTVQLAHLGDQNVSISTSNLVSDSRVDDLKHYIQHLNNLNEEQLKELYQQQLTNGEFGEKGGAGLGFLNMIRKTTDKTLHAHFEPAIAGYQHFNLQIKL
jgi:hypothetical protein